MKYKNIITILFICICFSILIISAYFIIKDYIAYTDNKQLTEGLVENVIEVNPDTKESYIDWEKLKSINKDIIGWIKIEDTKINYPILKDNNLYYLNHSYNKKYNKNGSIFTTNNNPFIDDETVIYGHNMKNGTMFSELGKYLKKDFLDNHNYIKIYTPNGNYDGTIISAYSIGIDIENNNIKSLDFCEKLEYYKETSTNLIECKDVPTKIVKLSTCSYINAKYTPTEQRYYIIASINPIN